MRIRPACPDELETLYGIVRDATRHMDEQGIPQWDEVYPTKDILLKDIDRNELHVMEVEGQLAGIIVLNEEQSPEYAAVQWMYPGRALVVHRLAVHPAYQRKEDMRDAH